MSIKYRHLLESPIQIRVLELQPAKDELAPLKAKLLHTSLEDAQYQALSYVWGDQKVNRIDIEITYQPESFSGIVRAPEVFYTSVGENLGTALRYVRQSGTELVLWADAICIDQGDNVEKSHQVKLMYEIFQNASLVVAWLGPSGPFTRYAIEHMKNILLDLKELHFEGDAQDINGFINWLRLKWESKDAVDDKGCAISLPLRSLSLLFEQDVQFMRGALDLYSRQYWSRVWIVQEYIAASAIRIRCGHQSLSSQAFYMIAALQYSYDVQIGTKIWTLYPNDLLYTNPTPKFQVLASLHSFHIGKEYFPRLVMRVNGPNSSTMGATDPRDRIFALLGAASDTYGLEPDYNKDVARVYLDATIAFLEHGYLWPLNFGLYGQDSSNPTWPSWMVDWSSIARLARKDSSYSSTSISIQTTDSGTTELRPPSVSFPNSNSAQPGEAATPRLLIQGLIISTVAQTTPSFHELEPQVTEVPAKEEPTLNELLLELDPFMPLLKIWLTALHSTMRKMGITDTEPGIEEKISNVLMSYLSSPYTPIGILNDQFKATLVGLVTSLIANSDHLWIHEPDTEVLMARVADVLGQLTPTYLEHKEEKWVISRNGYIGLTEYPVQKEDVIAVFGALSGQQCCVFVLREAKENVYRIIGKVHMPEVDKNGLLEDGRNITTFTIV